MIYKRAKHYALAFSQNNVIDLMNNVGAYVSEKDAVKIRTYGGRIVKLLAKY
jgi:hypothetical protein